MSVSVCSCHAHCLQLASCLGSMFAASPFSPFAPIMPFSPFNSFGAPWASVPRETCTIFSSVPYLSFRSFKPMATWANFPGGPHSALETPLSDGALFSFQAWSSRYSWDSVRPGYSWHSRRRIWLFNQKPTVLISRKYCPYHMD